MVSLEDIVEGEWLDWYRLTPWQRWEESGKLWAEYLRMGGSLDPEYDPQSPFNDMYYPDGDPNKNQVGDGPTASVPERC